MKFKYNLTLGNYSIFLTLAILLGFSIVYNCLKIFELFNFSSPNVLFDTITTALCAVGICLCVCILTMNYRLTHTLSLKLGPIILFECETLKILNVKIINNKLYLSCLKNGSFDPVIIKVAIYNTEFEKFKNKLKDLNERVVLEEEYEQNSNRNEQ